MPRRKRPSYGIKRKYQQVRSSGKTVKLNKPIEAINDKDQSSLDADHHDDSESDVCPNSDPVCIKAVNNATRRKRKRPSYGHKRKYQQIRSTGKTEAINIKDRCSLNAAFCASDDNDDASNVCQDSDLSSTHDPVCNTSAILVEESDLLNSAFCEPSAISVCNPVIKTDCYRATTECDLAATTECDLSAATTECDLSAATTECDLSAATTEDSDMLDTAFCDMPEVEVEENVTAPYEALKNELMGNLSKPFLLHQHSDDIQILSLYENSVNTSIKLKVLINRDFHAKVIVHGKVLPESHFLWDRLPRCFLSSKDVQQLLDMLEGLIVCVGNPDEDFVSLTPVGTLITTSTSAEAVAYHEGNYGAVQGSLTYSSTIRSTKCSLLVEGVRCKECSKYRRKLRDKQTRINELIKSDRDFTKSTYKHCDMPRTILIRKIEQQKDQISCLQSKVEKLERRLRKEISKSGVTVGKDGDRELNDLMALCESEVEKAYPDSSSYQRLFWAQQRKYQQNGKYAMRWHPIIIRWCLYIRQKSQVAYDAVRESGFINLPSNRTLFDYSHYIKSDLGFNADVLKMLKEEAGKLGMFSEEWRGYVDILFDEIKIKEDLVYDKHTGDLIGYCSLDDIGNTIMNLESALSETESMMAKSVLVLMVRGVCSSLTFPLAAFATQSITADYLYPIIWKAVSLLEVHIRLKVLFLTCDGASPNRKFFNLHRLPRVDSVHYSVNPFDPSRNVYFISDVPHLIKTARNCFSNSYSHRNTRRLWCNGKDISWMHIVRLFEDHCELNLYTPCPRLTRGHINLNAFSYMKVRLAAQVLSDSVANALEAFYDDSVSETVSFIRNINKFFDIMNVRSLVEARNKRNPNLKPFEDVGDNRFEWLEGDFLNYLNSWRDSVLIRPGNFTKKDRAGMLLSHQTISGLQMSVKSIVACVKHALTSGATFVLTHSFNQDPLEQHFGHYRHKGGHNKNPTVNDVRHILTNIRTVGAQALVPKHGNTRGDNVLPPIDHTKLPRRR